MAERRPLVLKDGRIQELPQGDTIPGGSSGGGGGSGHLWWRIVPKSVDDRYCYADELILAGTTGGPQLATGGTAIASGQYGGQAPALAFDGDGNTYWEGNGGAQNYPAIWIGYQFATPVMINSFRWTCNTGRYPGELPVQGDVQYSDDGTLWTTAWTFKNFAWAGGGVITNQASIGVVPVIPPIEGKSKKILAVIEDESGLEWVTKPVPGGGGGGSGDVTPTDTGPSGYYGGLPAYKQWRIYGLNWQSEQYQSLSNVEFRTAIGVTEQATGGNAFLSSQYSGSNPASYAFDANDSTYAIVNNSMPSFIGYNFPEPIVVLQVAIRNRPDGYGHQAPYKFTVQASNDGAVWDDIWTVTTDPWPGSPPVQREFTRPDADEAGGEQHHYPTKIAALNDVDVKTGLTSGKALVWDSGKAKWVPGTVSAGGGAGGVAVGAHRYWGMLEMIATNGNLRFQAAAFYTKGVRKMPVQFDAMNYYSGGYEPDQLMDDTGNHWAAVSNVGWLYARFTDPVTIDEVRLLAVSGAQSQSPYTITFAWSDDGVNWHPIAQASVKPGSWDPQVWSSFALPANYNVQVDTTRIKADTWRVRAVSRTSQGNFSLAKLSINDANGNDLVGGGTAIASGYYDGNAAYVPANAFDADVNSAWWGRNGWMQGEWIGYQFAGAVAPVSITLTPTPGYASAMPTGLAVDYYKNGSWTELCQIDYQPWVAGTPVTFQLPETLKVINSGAGPVNGEMSQPYIVQSATMRNDGTIALIQPVTPGNVLLFVAGGWQSSLNNYRPAGYNYLTNPSSNENNGVLAQYKVITVAETISYDLSVGDNQFCALYEIANVGGVFAMTSGTYGQIFPTGTPNMDIAVPTLRISPTDLFFIAVEEDNAHQITFQAGNGFYLDIHPLTGGNHGGFIGHYDSTNDGHIRGTVSGMDAPVFGVWAVVGKFTPA